MHNHHHAAHKKKNIKNQNLIRTQLHLSPNRCTHGPKPRFLNRIASTNSNPKAQKNRVKEGNITRRHHGGSRPKSTATETGPAIRSARFGNENKWRTLWIARVTMASAGVWFEEEEDEVTTLPVCRNCIPCYIIILYLLGLGPPLY